MSSIQTKLDHAFIVGVNERRIPGIAAVVLDRHGNTIFKGCYGNVHVDNASAHPVTPTTMMKIYSLTKLVTVVAALQLLEDGRFDLDDPVQRYVPSVGQVQVLEGFSEHGEPLLRPPRTKITIRHLMTHTAGFTYPFLDQDTRRYRKWFWNRQGKQVPDVMSEEEYVFPLAFDPGMAYSYGISIDWLGLVVEFVSQMSLDDYFTQHIFSPLGMTKTGNKQPADVWLHVPDGKDKVSSICSANTDVDAHGGHYLNSNLDEYSTFLVTILNGGFNEERRVRLLKAETVAKYLFSDHINSLLEASPDVLPAKAATIGVFKTADPRLSLDGELLPGVSKGWSLGLMLAKEPVKDGRNAGSGSWAGLGNLFCWLDPTAGILGLVMTSILPFMNKDVLDLCSHLERAVYKQDGL